VGADDVRAAGHAGEQLNSVVAEHARLAFGP
jgi:hypothetical protein